MNVIQKMILAERTFIGGKYYKEILNEKYDARIQSFDDLRIEYL